MTSEPISLSEGRRLWEAADKADATATDLRNFEDYIWLHFGKYFTLAEAAVANVAAEQQNINANTNAKIKEAASAGTKAWIALKAAAARFKP